MPSHCTVELHVAVNNIKPPSLAMEKQEWVPFSLLPCYKIVRTAGNSLIVIRSSWEVPYLFVPFQPNLEFLLRFLYNFSCTTLHENASSGSRNDTCGKTDGQT